MKECYEYDSVEDYEKHKIKMIKKGFTEEKVKLKITAVYINKEK
jgi:hypothetical protein